jgi:hypothetical protein
VKRILSGLCLLVFCCSIAIGQAPARPEKGARRIARPAASQFQPTLAQRLLKRFSGWISTFDEEEPPPPPDRVLSPVPG